MRIFISAGATLLPKDLIIDNLLTEGPLPSKHNVNGKFTESKIADVDYELNDVDKTVRRISNAQSRWLLYSGIKTWRDSPFNQVSSPEQRGLFLGLGTSDADDNITPVGFAAKDKESYVATALTGMQPTIGLTLLNTSSASQLAQHLDIRGDNAFFSPHCDAGASALIEGFYSVYQQKNKVALCGGASQKISEWFYLSYEKALIERNSLNLTEASAFVLLHGDEREASAELNNMRRTVIHSQPQYGQFIKNYQHLTGKPSIIIHTGPGSKKYDFLSPEENIFAGVPIMHFDKHFGYCGAASVFLAINYAIRQWNSREANAGSKHDGPASQVLIINHGLQGNCAAMVLNFNRAV